jgi:hypothetical protein
LAVDDRPSRTSQPTSRTKIRYSSRSATPCDHASTAHDARSPQLSAQVPSCGTPQDHRTPPLRPRLRTPTPLSRCHGPLVHDPHHQPPTHPTPVARKRLLTGATQAMRRAPLFAASDVGHVISRSDNRHSLPGRIGESAVHLSHGAARCGVVDRHEGTAAKTMT